MRTLEESFEQTCLNIRKRVSDKEFERFSNEKNKVLRFGIIDKIKETDIVNSFINYKYGKNLSEALEYKNEGNRQFKNTRWSNALDFYNRSYIMTPGENVKDVAIILGNRSACLFHMKEYQIAINDIERAEKDFPSETVYKLLDRKAKCYVQIGNYCAALNAYKQTYQMVCTNEKIPTKQRQTIQEECEFSIKNLQRNSGAYIFGVSECHDFRKLKGDESYINPSYAFDYTEREGRYAICKQDIDVGELLLSETPFCAVVLEKFSQTHCQICFSRPLAPVACDRCSDVIFCSDKCKTDATFHKFECGILKTLWASKASVTCHLSMRMMAVYPLTFFIEVRKDLERKMTHEEIDALPSRDYRKAYALVTHEENRTMEEMFHRTLMAKFLLGCLLTNGYLKGNEHLREYIGNLILHNIQVLQFNAHEVYELQKDQNDYIGRTEFIGGAIYPILALFNHSCDPATVRYFDGKRVYVHSMRPLREGEQIGENYGPIFTLNQKEERQLHLKQQYKFECRCQPCIEDWPLYKQMKNDFMKFRCAEKQCNEVITVNANTEEIMIKCPKCSTTVSILERLKVISKIDSTFEEAIDLFKDNKIKEALDLYLNLLRKLDGILAPPYADYHICQQGIRRCFLENGNVIKFENNSEACTTTSYFM